MLSPLPCGGWGHHLLLLLKGLGDRHCRTGVPGQVCRLLWRLPSPGTCCHGAWLMLRPREPPRCSRDTPVRSCLRAFAPAASSACHTLPT